MKWFAAALFIHPFRQRRSDGSRSCMVNPACAGFIVPARSPCHQTAAFRSMMRDSAISAHHRETNALSLPTSGRRKFLSSHGLEAAKLVWRRSTVRDELRIAGITFKCRLAKSGDSVPVWVTASANPCRHRVQPASLPSVAVLYSSRFIPLDQYQPDGEQWFLTMYRDVTVLPRSLRPNIAIKRLQVMAFCWPRGVVSDRCIA